METANTINGGIASGVGDFGTDTVCANGSPKPAGGLQSDSAEIASRVRLLFGVEPKAKQVEAIHSLIVQNRDTVLVAGTGFGKSLVFQAAPLLLTEAQIALMIMPLRLLQDEQAIKLSRIEGCSPFVLNGDSNTASNLKKIRDGRLTHVLTSPEIALSKRFNDQVLRYPQFYNRLCLLAIDECHLVEDWKGFRPEYAQLGLLRNRLPESVPILGVTATLEPLVTSSILKNCNFKPDVNIIRTPLDRPEIYIQCSVMTRAMKGMLDLQHLLPEGVERAADIPKTIVFMETIALVLEATKLIRSWMTALRYPSPIPTMVQPFFAAMAKNDKDRISKGFSEPSEMGANPRIVIATEAYGMGIDNPDISRVVQWGLPNGMSRLYQRMGRAMRCRRGQGHFTFLFPPTAVGPRQADTKANKKKQAEAESRSKICFSLWRLMNEESPVCLRKIGLEFFEAVDAKEPLEEGRVCCSNCNRDASSRLDVHASLNKVMERNSSRRPWYTESLEGWRRKKANEEFKGFVFPESSCILPDAVLERLAAYGDQVGDIDSLARLVGNTWAEISEYGGEVLEILLRGQALPVELGEVFDAWVRMTDIRSKRVVVQPSNPHKSDFESRRLDWIRETASPFKKKENGPLLSTPGRLRLPKVAAFIPAAISSPKSPDPQRRKRKTAGENEESPIARRQHQKTGSKAPVVGASPRILKATRTRKDRKLPARYEE